MKKIHKCKVCKKNIRQSSGPGRPKTTHARCKSAAAKKAAKKKTKKKVAKKKTKKTLKKAKTTRRGRSSTRSRQGRQIMGAHGWLSLWFYGESKGGRGSDKTWAVKVEKKKGSPKHRVHTRHGRRTGQKNVTTHSWMSKTAALKKANTLLRSKLTKGYEFFGANRKMRRRKSRR